MNSEVKTWRRYLNFFLVGIAVEGSRLVSFWLFAKVTGPELANILSLPINVVIAFLLFGRITWRDRPGSSWGKLIRFTAGKWFVLALKGGVFPLWRSVSILSCPLYEITHWAVNLLPSTLVSTLMHALFNCDWMSLATMDFALAMTLGFIINDKFSFWRRS